MPDVAKHIASEIIRGKKVLIWIGAGTSFTAGIPTDAADKHGIAWILALIHYGDEQAVIQQMGMTFRLADLTLKLGKGRIRDLLLQLGWTDLTPAPAHQAIAALIVEGFHIDVVTTNFDPLLERSIELLDSKTEVVFSGATVGLLSEEAIAVVKVHGCPYLDPNPEHLLLLEAELLRPPAWVVNFLNGRLQERIFVYSGFSGNAPYVWESIGQVRVALEGQLNSTFAVDLAPADTVFASGNTLGAFYVHCQVEQANYAEGGADNLFDEVADRVFRELLLAQIGLALNEVKQLGAQSAEFLETITKELPYETIRGFAKRVRYLAKPQNSRVRDVDLVGAFTWMILLTSKGVLEASSFRPRLSCPYHPGPVSLASAPIVFLDGSQKQALLCRAQIHELANQKAFKQEFQLAAVPRWFAVVFNCRGVMDDTELDVIPREANATVAGYDPVICRDENSLLAAMDDLPSEFAL
jgi:SIR2-like domain